jgi:hypothetical protein
MPILINNHALHLLEILSVRLKINVRMLSIIKRNESAVAQKTFPIR